MTSIVQATGLVLLSTSLTFSIRSPTHFFSKKTHIFSECHSNLLYSSVNTSEFTFLLCLNLGEPFEIRISDYNLEKSKDYSYKKYCKGFIQYAKQLKQFE